MTVEKKFNGDLPQTSAADAAAEIPANGTVLVIGFGSVGYPKSVRLAFHA